MAILVSSIQRRILLDPKNCLNSKLVPDLKRKIPTKAQHCNFLTKAHVCVFSLLPCGMYIVVCSCKRRTVLVGFGPKKQSYLLTGFHEVGIGVKVTMGVFTLIFWHLC